MATRKDQDDARDAEAGGPHLTIDLHGSSDTTGAGQHCFHADAVLSASVTPPPYSHCHLSCNLRVPGDIGRSSAQRIFLVLSLGSLTP
jgi:hypothetical protein